MLDIKFIRDNTDLVRQAIKNKNANVENLDKVLSLDDVRRKLIIDVEAIRSRRNEITEKLQKDKNDDLIAESKQLKEKLTVVETELANVEKDWTEAMLQIPNIPLSTVPVGSDEAANKILRTEGKPAKFSFKPKDHIELGEALDIIDITRATKVSGARFAYLKNEGALLELALIQYAFGRLTKNGFHAVLPPAMIKQNITEGLGYWQAGGNDNYYMVEDLEDNGRGERKVNPLYLVGTAEHAIVPMHKDETFADTDLPKKYVGLSPAFRREAGSYGRDTRGILRVHQFDKVEMVAFAKADQDEMMRKEMLDNAEAMLKDLGLPYQVVQLCTGDISFPAAETIDIETWIPSQEKYRETHSISTTTNFQSRRLNIWYKSKEERRHVYILNGTAIAVPRIIIAILENNQQEDGSILIPHALQPYLGFDRIKKK